MSVPPSEAQLAGPESLSGADVGVVVVVDGLVVVVEGRVVVVDRWGPPLDAAAPEVADTTVLAIASAATTAAAASVVFLGLGVQLRIGVLSVVDAPPVDRSGIGGGSSAWSWSLALRELYQRLSRQ
jgi:hypothetical protein